MDLSALTAPIDSKRDKESGVTTHSEIAPETCFIGDEWIRQPTQPLLTQKESRKTESFPTQKSFPKLFQSWPMDSSAHTAPVDSKTIKENWVAAHSEIIIEIVSRADPWIYQCPQPLLTHKQSRKTESLPTQK